MILPRTTARSSRLLATAGAVLFGLLRPVDSAPAAPTIVEVPYAARPPYTIVREAVTVTVGETLSLVDIAREYVYVWHYDTDDKKDPMLVDVPVFVSATETDPGKILKLASIRLAIGRNQYHPREVLWLDHEAVPPVPLVPGDGTRIALISFNLPRAQLKPRFRLHITFEQPHVTTDDGRVLAPYLPLLPDYDQLHEAMHFKPDDHVVTFTTLPEVGELRRDTPNAAPIAEAPREIKVHPRHRETIAVEIVPADAGDGDRSEPASPAPNDDTVPAE